MNVVLLCAGFATRMYPLTRNFPKPLLPVGEQPVLDRQHHRHQRCTPGKQRQILRSLLPLA